MLLLRLLSAALLIRETKQTKKDKAEYYKIFLQVELYSGKIIEGPDKTAGQPTTKKQRKTIINDLGWEIQHHQSQKFLIINQQKIDLKDVKPAGLTIKIQKPACVAATTQEA